MADKEIELEFDPRVEQDILDSMERAFRYKLQTACLPVGVRAFRDAGKVVFELSGPYDQVAIARKMFGKEFRII